MIWLTRAQDPYNENKVWLIKKSIGNYYVNQEICGKKIYSAFQRVRKEFIEHLLDK